MPAATNCTVFLKPDQQQQVVRSTLGQTAQEVRRVCRQAHAFACVAALLLVPIQLAAVRIGGALVVCSGRRAAWRQLALHRHSMHSRQVAAGSRQPTPSCRAYAMWQCIPTFASWPADGQLRFRSCCWPTGSCSHHHGCLDWAGWLNPGTGPPHRGKNNSRGSQQLLGPTVWHAVLACEVGEVADACTPADKFMDFLEALILSATPQLAFSVL